ncbi:pentapeptide repeat-containing protein [Nonomuraea sp. LP-02]|uniref:pentapeptide repeat-containing protein n=1 Tax=Nonomuraea sp. LP-02 TaxID=3097960 RepID=UPI002E368643|nr:pentapeptide repeat-containing protein [Nonomuraea sp. LP-02]MED7927437.1 pentapeptide repeat-containing protein [Nonomuraea sp. LP-02]
MSYPPIPGMPGLTPDGKPSSGISFTKDELAKAGGKIGDQTQLIGQVNQRSDQLPVPWPHFGVLGWGVQNVHEKAIQSQREALARAKEALESWDPALRAADKNYTKADDSSGDPNNLPKTTLPGGGLPGGGLPNTKLPKTDLPNTDLPKTNLPNTDLPKTNLPNTDLPNTDLPNTDVPGGNLPNPNLPGTDLPNANLPGTNTPGANLPGTDLPKTDLPGMDPISTRVPDLDAALNPNKTDLSSFQPTATPTPQVPTFDPNSNALGTRTNVPGSLGLPSTGTVPSTGVGLGGGGLVPGSAAAAGMRGAAAGMSGMPMMPMMPMSGAGNANQERDRDKTVGLGEDEGVWGGDEDIAPPVLGQEDDLL